MFLQQWLPSSCDIYHLAIDWSKLESGPVKKLRDTMSSLDNNQVIQQPLYWEIWTKMSLVRVNLNLRSEDQHLTQVKQNYFDTNLEQFVESLQDAARDIFYRVALSSFIPNINVIFQAWAKSRRIKGGGIGIFTFNTVLLRTCFCLYLKCVSIIFTLNIYVSSSIYFFIRTVLYLNESRLTAPTTYPSWATH